MNEKCRLSILLFTKLLNNKINSEHSKTYVFFLISHFVCLCYVYIQFLVSSFKIIFFAYIKLNLKQVSKLLSIILKNLKNLLKFINLFLKISGYK